MWYNILIVVILVILAGTFAGLTLALFGIKLTTLERKIRLGDHQAEKVYRIRKEGNRLLCTLLLGNVASYSSMTVFLGSITSGVIAGVIATALIFIFGEIVPQAVFPRYALWIGAKLSWLVWFLLFLFYPIATPIAWVLDKILGEEPPVLWSKQELGEIIKYHKDVGDGIIDKDEERIILGALSFSELLVENVMIPRTQVFSLDQDDSIDEDLLETIKVMSFSRIPVLNSTSGSVEGILYTKNLIGMKPGTYTVGELCTRDNLIIIHETIRLDNLMNILVKKKIHMAIVVDRNNHFSGVVTLEDVMEEILRTELEDLKF